MRIITSHCLVTTLALVGLGGLPGCSSSDSSPQDNAGFESCASPAILGCTYQGSCHNFYSVSSAKQGRESCASVQGQVFEGGCPQSYAQCCVVWQGSFDEPEGICVDSSDPRATDYRSICYGGTESAEYCGG